MAIMDMFRSKPVAPVDPAAVAAQQASAGNNPTVPSATTPQSNGSNPAIPAAGTGDQSPLANFADLWKTDPNTPAASTTLTPPLAMDYTKLKEASQKMSFTDQIPQELLAKAMTDPAAFAQVLNQVGQLGFAQGMAGSGELVNQALSKASGTVRDTMIPEALRSNSVQAAITQENPMFSNPAAAPMLASLATQFQQKYPTAAPAEIARMAKEYLTGFSQEVVRGNGGTIVPPGQPGSQQLARQDTNWETYFSGGNL